MDFLDFSFSNFFVGFYSWLKLCFKRTKAKTVSKKCGKCCRKACREEEGNFDPCDPCKLRNWLENYDLSEVNAFSLFNEFLEMGSYLSQLPVLLVLQYPTDLPITSFY